MIESPPTRRAIALDQNGWRGRVAVVSPHLDDAVFSLGASMRAASRDGCQIHVVTVLAGDPSSTVPADSHNRRAGFGTAGEAARARRREDDEACRRVDVTARWLPLSDDGNQERSIEEVRSALGPALESFDAVVLPGFPLVHPDHRLVSGLALEVLPPGRVVGLYVEQPYASWNALMRAPRTRVGRDAGLAHLGIETTPAPSWSRQVGRPSDWIAKNKAMAAYASQLPILRRVPRTRILAYEAIKRGEAVLWLELG